VQILLLRPVSAQNTMVSQNPNVADAIHRLVPHFRDFIRIHQLAARRYEPLVDKPDVSNVQDLSPDRESVLRFANLYGWIGREGMVNLEGGCPLEAVGLSTWEEEIQNMIIAEPDCLPWRV
jgi:hypothetical protein